MGLVESAAEYFPETRWQRCTVHWYRSVFSHVPAGKVREVALMLKAIHAQESLEAAQQKAVEVVTKLRTMRLGKAADLVEAGVSETLTYYACPEEHWRRIRTNNPLERIARDPPAHPRGSPMEIPRSIWPRPGYGTSRVRAGRPPGSSASDLAGSPSNSHWPQGSRRPRRKTTSWSYP